MVPRRVHRERAVGEALRAQKRYEEALPEIEAAWGVLTKELPGTHDKVISIRTEKARVLMGVGKFAAAGVELEAVYSVLEPRYGSASARCREIAGYRAEVAGKTGDEQGAAMWRSRSG